MRGHQWRKKLGDLVREFSLRPEIEEFFSLKVTPQRAKLYVLQLGLYIKKGRDYWAQVAANCMEMDVKD